MGAAIALGGVVPLDAQNQADSPKPTTVVDVAADRMLKGHS